MCTNTSNLRFDSRAVPQLQLNYVLLFQRISAVNILFQHYQALERREHSRSFLIGIVPDVRGQKRGRIPLADQNI